MSRKNIVINNVIVSIMCMILILSQSGCSKKNAVTKIQVPVGADECVDKTYTEISDQLSNSGFTNITSNKIEDLKPSESDKLNQIKDISIDGKTGFAKNDEYDSDVPIVINYHGYVKCAVNVHIDFIPNLLFNKYKVEFKVDGNSEGVLDHGKDGDFKLALEPGTHTVEFVKENSSSVKGEETLEVGGEVNISYQISCEGDKVSTKVEYVENLGDVGENEIMMPSDAYSYKSKNYKDVEAELKKLGFSNINYDILYDIVFGLTSEGTLESISIAGKNDFNRGDIFSADDEILLSYHMKESADPNKQIEQKESEIPQENQEKEVPRYEEIPRQKEIEETVFNVDNNDTFAAMMSISDQSDSETIKGYVSSLSGKKVEFDCTIALMQKHGNYKTRFDVCLAHEDSSGKVKGPIFAIENANYSDMNVSGSDSVSAGMKFHIVAKIEGYNSDGNYVVLDPVSMTLK